MRYYTGVGSRGITEEVYSMLLGIGRDMAYLGFILRSGGADGADSAFEDGCNLGTGSKNIFLPWKGFNGNNSLLFNVSKPALELAEEVHPRWDLCRQGARLLHARNCYQVLGENLSEPSDLLVCWTAAEETGRGGTLTAINLARRHEVPVFNLYYPRGMQEFQNWQKENGGR